MIYRKNEMLEHLKIMEWELVNIFSTASVVLKMNNAKCKGYVNKKFNEEMDNEDPRLGEAILDSSTF